MDETYKGGVEAAIRNAVLDVALAHHLVSKYTSLVAVDVTPSRPTDTSMAEQAASHANMDKRVSIRDLPRGATSAQVKLAMGAAILTLAWLLWGCRRRFV